VRLLSALESACEKESTALSILPPPVRLELGNPAATQRNHVMQYLLLIYENEAQTHAMSPDALTAMLNEYRSFTQSIVQTGQFKAGDALQPTATATTVRVRNGKIAVTDGPFAETREQLGCYYLVEAKDLNDAVAIAARIPGAQYGSIEVRPIMVFS
jgi:hypothetical protein